MKPVEVDISMNSCWTVAVDASPTLVITPPWALVKWKRTCRARHNEPRRRITTSSRIVWRGLCGTVTGYRAPQWHDYQLWEGQEWLLKELHCIRRYERTVVWVLAGVPRQLALLCLSKGLILWFKSMCGSPISLGESVNEIMILFGPSFGPYEVEVFSAI